MKQLLKKLLRVGTGLKKPNTAIVGGSIMTLGGSIMTLGGSILTLGGSILTLEGSILTLGGSILTLGGSTLTLRGSILTHNSVHYSTYCSSSNATSFSPGLSLRALRYPPIMDTYTHSHTTHTLHTPLTHHTHTHTCARRKDLATVSP